MLCGIENIRLINSSFMLNVGIIQQNIVNPT